MARGKVVFDDESVRPLSESQLTIEEVALTVGANLRRLRREQRMSLSEMARVSQTAKATLSNLESGTGNPTLTTLAALANVLGVTLADLMESPAPRLMRARDGHFAKGRSTIGRLLTRHHASSVDIHEVTFKGDKPFKSCQPESDALEQIYLMSGDLKITVAGEVYHLEPGDIIQYPLKDGAEITALGKDAKVIIVMAYTLRSGQSGSAFS